MSDLPPIQVIVGQNNNNHGGSKESNEPWYFSLNNRRLWVLKRLRDEGLLEPFGNKVFVRVRSPKSQQERERYCVENCALEAKIVAEKSNTTKASKKTKNNNNMNDHQSTDDNDNANVRNGESSDQRARDLFGTYESIVASDSDSDSDSDLPSNRFGALLLS